MNKQREIERAKAWAEFCALYDKVQERHGGTYAGWKPASAQAVNLHTLRMLIRQLKAKIGHE